MAKRKTPLLILTALILFGLAALPFFKRGTQALSWQNDYEQALEQARSENQLLIAYLFTDWCGYCRQMEKNTFADADVIATMGSQYTWLRLNAETDPDGVRLKERFGISGYPAILILDSQGSEMDRIEGYLPPDRFQSAVQASAESNDAFGELLQQAESQPGSHETRYELGKRYLERRDFAQASTQFSTVVQLDPENQSGRTDDALYYLALSLASLEREEEALLQLDRLENRFSSSELRPDAMVLRGQILYYEGAMQQAQRVFRDYLRHYPEHTFSGRVRELLAEMGPQPIGLASSH